MNLNRRELLMGGSVALGTFFSASTLGALANNITVAEANNTHGFLSKEHFLTLTQITEIIMPRTDTPGAIDAGVAETLDEVFAKTLTKSDQQKLENGWNVFEKTCQALYQKTFLVLPPDQQIEFIKILNSEFVKAPNTNKKFVSLLQAESVKTQTQQAVEFFGMLKYFTLLIFFRSKPGATQVLQYVAIPGRYNAKAPLKEIGKTWATQ